MSKSQDLAICLVSGGMDSLVTAAIANTKHERLAFLHLNYGQKTEKRELKSFHDIAEFYGVPESHRKIIDVSFLKQIGGSSLTDDSINVKNYEGDKEVIPDSYVPFRNTHIVSMAVSWAEVIGAKKIFIGAVYEDSSGYPDCRPSYYKALNALIKEGTKDGDIEVITPVILMKKEEIVKKAVEMKAPLELTWSCYSSEDKSCGICDSCALRLRGFQKAGIEDPLPYHQRPKYI
ncbi:MAG: 7-cyano-7-deazaguanine synthase QueC [Bdellovibrio sp. CG12_big_fil_rev_8_21_14_0_65_39_13]|nr:MAG: 7-cyano-7-deazaguanine synthase QueC [Bdellovibrio sp. CG22_combo_CG10-13_8_21_14_all_39_27]PIQ59262.1 MAG: 7-cyano-7-deazaguanine synthase QueC [Bdellovibrio sp. CG12_big_fil_rev_8_21_14_0_65_39_13]PIR32273.1 MAG: 7-cyano-7-deazaguanine synthase QueC [Bdellovibrio sp. CG11_big_fil_rev_8_21_14_0_20_39_38]PJB54047.1 MAG: 7-cyano-7-deazaguanine synthase QueC [Bdellovibrio sp. CG_4_9_14_3_um_filter_39_7]